MASRYFTRYKKVEGSATGQTWDDMKVVDACYSNPKVRPGTCEKCVFGEGEHSVDCVTLTPVQENLFQVYNHLR